MVDIWWTAPTQPLSLCEVAIVTSFIVKAIGWGVMAANASAEG